MKKSRRLFDHRYFVLLLIFTFIALLSSQVNAQQSAYWELKSNETADYLFNDWVTLDNPIRDNTTSDSFGSDIAFQGDWLLVGDPDSNEAGQVFIYNLSSGEPQLETVLQPSDGEMGDKFGYYVTAQDDVIAVFSACGSKHYGGCVYLYTKQADNSYREQRLQGTGSFGSRWDFGRSVAIQGSKVAIGAPYAGTETDKAVIEHGKVFVYEADVSGHYALKQTILPNLLEDKLRFGASLSFSQDGLLIGSPGAETYGRLSGDIYFFTRNSDGIFEERDSEGQLDFSNYKLYRYGENVKSREGSVYSTGVTSSEINRRIDDIVALTHKNIPSVSLISTAFVDFVNPTISVSNAFTVANENTLIALSTGESETFPPYYNCWVNACGDHLYIHEITHDKGEKIQERRFRLGGEQFYRSANVSASEGKVLTNNSGDILALSVTDFGLINFDGSDIEGESKYTGRVFLYRRGKTLSNNDYLSFSLSENTQLPHYLKPYYEKQTQGSITLTGEDARFFTVDANGKIEFKSSPDFENPLDSNGDNTYRLSAIVVSADQAASSTVHLFIDVNEVPDNDLDGLEDNLDLDDDNDGVPDLVEIAQGTDEKDINSYLDTDKDTVPDFFEDGTYGNNRLAPDAIDSDSDGVSDYIEAFSGVNDKPVWSYVEDNALNRGQALRQVLSHQTFDDRFSQTGEITKDSGLIYVPDPAYNVVHVYDSEVLPYEKTATLRPSDLAWDDDADIDFGSSIASDNGTIVVGAYSDSENGTSAGAIYIYNHLGGGQYSETKLLATDGGSEDFFGRSVDIDNGVIVVGANYCAIEGQRVGCAYVYTPNSTGTGYSETKLIGSGATAYAGFGFNVAIDKQTIVVSAAADDSVYEDSGSVYVYTMQDDGRISEQKLIPNDPEYRGDFGSDVDVSEGVIVVGLREDRNLNTIISGGNIGKVYVYKKGSDSQYHQTNTLYENNLKTFTMDSMFGAQVKIDNGVIYSGFYQDDHQALNVKGIYRFYLTDLGGYQREQLSITTPDDYIRVQNHKLTGFYADATSVYMAADYQFVIADNGNTSTIDPFGTITEFRLDSQISAEQAVSITLEEHNTLTSLFNAFDPDGDDLTVSLAGKDAEHFTYHAGLLQFTHQPVVADPQDFGKDNTYDLSLSVTDGELTSTINIAVTVIENWDVDGDGIDNYSDNDNDNDGVIDANDPFPLDPNEWADTDGDGIGNNTDVDDDNDGINDQLEQQYGLNPLDPDDALSDLDSDGISNLEEIVVGTDPRLADTDGDGVSDYDEIVNRTDPLDPSDSAQSAIKYWVWQDINGDYAAEMIALKSDDLPRVKVDILAVPAMNSVVSKTLDMDLLWAELHSVGDLNGDGVDEVGVFGFIESENRYSLVALDTTNQLTLVRRFNWPASVAKGQLKNLPDLNGDGVSELALFGQHKLNKTNQLLVKDGLTGQSIRTFKWVNNWNQLDIVTLGDRNDDGAPEIALFGIHKRTEKGQLFVLDGQSGSKQEVYNWSKTLANGALFLPGDVNSDGNDDIGLFSQRTDDNRYQLFVKHGDTKAGRAASITWPNTIEDGHIFSVADMTFDGVNEVGIFGLSGSGDNARYKVWINSGADNQRVANLAWPNKWQEVSVRQVADYDQDGVRDIALFGYNTLTGDYEISVKSASSRLELGVIALGQDVEQLSVEFIDANGDGWDDMALAWQDGVTQKRNLVVIEAATLALMLVNVAL
ncbi:hypothetical protein L4C42_09410 [Vibrio wakamikoensis]|uniref:FG-GAP repeat protein n=1 Tax=Vibrio wakamikoensis TaxID=2910251 RepID=UPI003D19167D